jgi:hypothetical protein
VGNSSEGLAEAHEGTCDRDWSRPAGHLARLLGGSRNTLAAGRARGRVVRAGPTAPRTPQLAGQGLRHPDGSCHRAGGLAIRGLVEQALQFRRRKRPRTDPKGKWSGTRVSNPRHSAWKAGERERNSVPRGGASVTCPVIVSSFGPVRRPNARSLTLRVCLDFPAQGRCPQVSIIENVERRQAARREIGSGPGAAAIARPVDVAEFAAEKAKLLADWISGLRRRRVDTLGA